MCVCNCWDGDGGKGSERKTVKKRESVYKRERERECFAAIKANVTRQVAEGTKKVKMHTLSLTHTHAHAHTHTFSPDPEWEQRGVRDRRETVCLS